MNARLIVSTLTILVAATAAGGLAFLVGLPLPWLLGPLLFSALLSLSGLRIAGIAPKFPAKGRLIAVPIIGVAIGSGLSPDIARQIPNWWPSLISLVPFAIALQLCNYGLFRWVGRYDKATAFFAASPGGLVEAVLLGEKEGGKPALMSIQHVNRIALSVMIIPNLFLLDTGHEVGSAAGVTMTNASLPLTSYDITILILTGVIGLIVGKKLKLPAAIMVGPMLASAVLHMSGWVLVGVPQNLVSAAQIIIGMAIGLRFAGLERRVVFSGLKLAVIAVAVSLVFAASAASLLYLTGVASWAPLFLAFAPGGVAEMSLIAISLDTSPIFVTIHHVGRIVIAVLLSRPIFEMIKTISRKH